MFSDRPMSYWLALVLGGILVGALIPYNIWDWQFWAIAWPSNFLWATALNLLWAGDQP